MNDSFYENTGHSYGSRLPRPCGLYVIPTGFRAKFFTIIPFNRSKVRVHCRPFVHHATWDSCYNAVRCNIVHNHTIGTKYTVITNNQFPQNLCSGPHNAPPPKHRMTIRAKSPYPFTTPISQRHTMKENTLPRNINLRTNHDSKTVDDNYAWAKQSFWRDINTVPVLINLG